MWEKFDIHVVILTKGPVCPEEIHQMLDLFIFPYFVCVSEKRQRQKCYSTFKTKTVVLVYTRCGKIYTR